MKRNRFFALTVLLVAFFSIVSCDEKVEPAEQSLIDPIEEPEVAVQGIYKMSAYYTTLATNLNGDNVSSRNQMTETICFNENYLELKANNSFTLTTNGPEIVPVENASSILECKVGTVISGTWTLEDNVLTLSYTMNSQQYDDAVLVSNEVISYPLVNQEIVTTENGEFVTATSAVEMIFTKQ